MGEEKPDEVLKGKRKPSPRLSTTSRNADIIIFDHFSDFIREYENIFKLAPQYDTIMADTRQGDGKCEGHFWHSQRKVT
jgi:hypothetical protein